MINIFRKISTKRKSKSRNLPEFLRPFLWSYDFDNLDLQEDKKVIIKNILDFGTKEATDWLEENYSRDEIQEVIKKTVRTEWSKKSINLWELIYEVSPREKRF